MTILVVEADAAVRNLLLEVLRDFGCLAVGVRNRALALQYLQSAGEHPELILLDLMMPGIDNRAICTAFCRHPTLAAIPIVVMSARVDLAEQARRLEVAAYLVKPFTVDTSRHWYARAFLPPVWVRRCAARQVEGTHDDPGGRR